MMRLVVEHPDARDDALGLEPPPSTGERGESGTEFGETDVKTQKRKALYEPVHGSAPDIAGQGKANPIAMLASFGMALRYSFDMGALADKLDQAIAAVLAKGLRTADLKSDGATIVSTAQMGEAILKEVQALHG